MRYLYLLLLAMLVLLSVSSGVVKVMQMPQEVAFFAIIGFSKSILIAFGAIQIVSGLMMIHPKTRFAGALIVYVTFLISAVPLVLAEHRLLVMLTVVVIVLLGLVMRKTRVDG